MQVNMLLTSVSIAPEPKQDPRCGLNGIQESRRGFCWKLRNLYWAAISLQFRID